MTSLIRQQDTRDVRPIRSLDWPTGRASDQTSACSPPGSDRSREADALRSEAEVLSLKLAEAEARQREAVEAARAQGAREASLAHARDDAKALELIAEGIRTAIVRFDSQLAASQGLAALLCQTALEKVFSDPKADCERTTRAIHRQVSGLRRESVLGIRVSAKDFTDERALAALSNSIGGSSILIERDPRLGHGECHIDLRLGHLELSLSQHWAELQTLLQRLSLEAASL